MNNLRRLLIQYGTPRNLKVMYILITLAALAIAGGAPATAVAVVARLCPVRYGPLDTAQV